MEIKELLTDGGISLVVLLTLIQISPIKIDPWSWLAKNFGKFINADITAKLEAHIAVDDRRTADAHRVRILRFNNELLRDIDHTKEEFHEVLAEIDAYEEYCREHPEYSNNRARLAIETIEETYKYCLKNHKFLEEVVRHDTQG